ncbi:MAG: hypothetical protein WBP55_10060 [Solirubrobacterales bacterium]
MTVTKALFALAFATAIAFVGFAGSPVNASAGAKCAKTSSGGLSMTTKSCMAPKKAKLINGKAIAPRNAPKRVKKAIAWANKIRTKPYIYGGGHASFKSRGYDCSGAVSYALRGGKFLSSPMASTGFMNWKKPGKGKWISVYSNPSHAYIVIAGLRFDTSNTGGNGPRWSKSLQSTSGTFKVRHPGRF